MRDTVMNEQYFAEYILEETERIRKFQNKLENNEVRDDRIYSVKRKIDAIQFELLIARYSAGEDVEKLENDFMQLLNDMPLYWNGNSDYIDMLWMMALAILFDVNREQFGILSDLVTQYNRKDALLEFFVNYKMNGNIGQLKGDYSFGFPYDKLTDIVTNREKAVEKLKEYLEKYWYVGHKNMGWYDIHKAKEKLYYGYWSFEAGAIAKILNLDDSNLKDVPYYPYDLVHYKSNSM